MYQSRGALTLKLIEVHGLLIGSIISYKITMKTDTSRKSFTFRIVALKFTYLRFMKSPVIINTTELLVIITLFLKLLQSTGGGGLDDSLEGWWW